MAHLTKEALLKANDLKEKVVELPSIEGTVKIRALPAAYSSQATSEALELKQEGREQVARVNTVRLEELQVLHALIEPGLDTVEEARLFMQQCGPAARTLVEAIDEISGVNKEDIQAAEARFRGGGKSEAGSSVGNGTGAGNG